MKLETFNTRGFEIFENAFDERTIENLAFEFERFNFGKTAKKRKAVAFGVRNLLNVAPFTRSFADSVAVRNLIEPIVGEDARIVRAIFFDKTPEANWKVPFHQDLTISVRERKDTDGFSAWSKKAGVFHVQPPVSVLENIVSLRVHLDHTDESNGALRVVAESHRRGRIGAAEIHRLKTQGEILNCPVGKGGAMLMRPLLIHASSAAANALHRRVLHFEFSSQQLPQELEWFGS